MTRDLLSCKSWLEAEGCTHAALESTGVYWKPIFNILEDSMQIILANARHIKNVPGRKTDVKDCEWIAQLLRHGLIRGSFIPPKGQRELRNLTRYRQKLIQQKASEINRIQKFLEDANIKLASVVSDINGMSARQMLQRIIVDDMTAPEMANLAPGRLRPKISDLELALEGHINDHHRLMLKVSLEMIASYDEAIEQLSKDIDSRMEQYRETAEKLQTIPGVKKRLLKPSLPRSDAPWIRSPRKRISLPGPA